MDIPVKTKKVLKAAAISALLLAGSRGVVPAQDRADTDLHQDHRLVNELTWNTFRDHLVLEYEIPKYDGDLGRPHLYVPLTESIVGKKIAHLQAMFFSQRDRHWFTEQTFRSLMRIRGMECRADGGYAEAFYCKKVVVG